jgi:FtsP/CotA-like multicopper oxidase with cupredoxin domain
VERIGDTLYGQTYPLANRLGPMDRPGKIPDDWLATSTSVKRRSLPSDWRNAIDASGTLTNGHQWRYASLCGEAMEYHDVPAEVAKYFDRIIDGAYFR